MEVPRTLNRMFRDDGISGAILVIWDSTCAYCVDTMSETSRKDLRADGGAIPGGACDVPFGRVSGANVTDFIRQAQASAANGLDFYNWVFVVGWWDSPDLLVFGVSSMGKGQFVAQISR